jgi:cytochrome c biogenesis protein CcmG/thiol:disulfide interchange protein DsbE
MMRHFVPPAAFIGLAIVLWVALGRNPAEVPSPLVGKPVPQFRLAQLEHPARTISPADMAGQVWLLNVWASWCIACREEHPALLALAEQSGVPVIGLNYKDVREDGLQWLDRLGNPYRTSGFDMDGRVGIDFGVYGVPETFVIDRKGIIRFKFIGGLTPEQIRKKLLPLIRELERA